MPRALRFALIAVPLGLAWPAIDYVRWHRRGFLHH